MRDTIDMAREARAMIYNSPHDSKKLIDIMFTPEQLKTFEALVRADERARLQPKKIKAVKDEYCHGDERYYANE